MTFYCHSNIFSDFQELNRTSLREKKRREDTVEDAKDSQKELKQKMEMQRRLFEDMINNVKQQTGVEIAKLRNEKKILVQ